MKRSITTRIILSIFLFMMLPLSALGSWFYFDLKESITEMEGERGTNDLQTAHQMLDYIAAGVGSNVKSNAFWADHHQAIAGGDLAFIEESVLTALDVYPDYSGAYLTDLQGKVIAKRLTGEDLALEAELPKIAAKLGDGMELSGVVQTAIGPQIVAMSKVTDEEGKAAPNGILYFLRPVDEQLLMTIKSINKTELMLYDGKQVIATRAGWNAAEAGALYSDIQSAAKPLIRSSNEPDGQATQSFDQILDILGNPIGFVGTETKSQMATEVRGKLLKMVGISAVLLLCGGLLLMFQLYKRVSQPLVRLRTEIIRVASGDLRSDETTQGHRDVGRRDEIGEIGHAFVAMTEGLKQLVRGVHEGANLLSVRSREFVTSSQEARSSLDLIASSSQDISSLVDLTFNEVTHASSHLLTLEGQANNISSHSVHAVQAATQMKQAVLEGQVQVDRSTAAMRSIRDSSQENETRMSALKTVADEIQTIVDQIKAISKQTGMLALNASIEAARAGEHGRGFAVVAQEVGKLSIQATHATDVIVSLVERIKTSVVHASETSQQFLAESEEGVSAVQATRISFDQILEQINDVEQLIQEIRLEAKTQEANTQEGVGAISVVRLMGADMVSRVQEAGTATDESLTLIDEFMENSRQLAELAEELLKDVSKFRV